MQKIRRDDEVVVLAGRDRGKTGTVQRILADGRALVAGVQMVKKHVRPNPQIGEKGGIVEREAPIHLSNLAVAHPSTGKPGRICVKTDAEGKRYRAFKSDSTPVDGAADSKSRRKKK